MSKFDRFIKGYVIFCGITLVFGIIYQIITFPNDTINILKDRISQAQTEIYTQHDKIDSLTGRIKFIENTLFQPQQR